MTYSTIRESVVSESIGGDEALSRGAFGGFSLVINVDGRGGVADAVVNAPTKVSDPEAVAKISLIMTVLARNLLNYLDSSNVEEINISFDKGMLLIVPEGDRIRVALTTAP